jgi:hypothetical protein
MKAFMKVAKAAVVSGIVLSVLMTTACGNGNQPAADVTQSPAQSQSATATPTPTATPTQAAKGPMSVDVDAVVKSADPTVSKTFPNETPETLKEGITFALSTYQGLIGIQNFYHARTASDNTLLTPSADKFDKAYFEAMTARTTANNGVIRDIIAFGKDGAITGGSLGVHVMDPKKGVNFVSGQPVVYAGATPANGNVLVVKANATMYAPTADDKLVTVNLNYWVNVSHVGPGKWLVQDMGWETPENPVVTDSVKAPNGK